MPIGDGIHRSCLISVIPFMKSVSQSLTAPTLVPGIQKFMALPSWFLGSWDVSYQQEKNPELVFSATKER